ASAITEERRKLLLRPALARRVELVGLVDQLKGPCEAAVHGRGDLAEPCRHFEGGEEILSAQFLALRLAFDLLLHHLGARRRFGGDRGTWVSGAHSRMRRHKYGFGPSTRMSGNAAFTAARSTRLSSINRTLFGSRFISRRIASI